MLLFMGIHCLINDYLRELLRGGGGGALSVRGTKTLLSISPLIFLLHHLDNLTTFCQHCYHGT